MRAVRDRVAVLVSGVVYVTCGHQNGATTTAAPTDQTCAARLIWGFLAAA